MSIPRNLDPKTLLWVAEDLEVKAKKLLLSISEVSQYKEDATVVRVTAAAAQYSNIAEDLRNRAEVISWQQREEAEHARTP